MTDYSALQWAVIQGDDKKTVQQVKEVLEQGAEPAEIVVSGLRAGMITVGSKFSSGEFFVPDMLLAARAMNRALEILRPRLANSGTVTIGRVVIGTVAGDIHDIGKNLVSIFLGGAGFEIIDLGTNVSSERFVTAVKRHSPDILGMSALITTTMPGIEATIKALESAALRRRVRVVIGGAPITQRFADQVGADGYATDGGAAIELCRRIIGR